MTDAASPPTVHVLFAGDTVSGRGSPEAIAAMAAAALRRDPQTRLLAFDAASGRQVDVDLRLAAPAGQAPRTATSPGASAGDTPPHAARRGRGRPRLGVEAREVTLLPRHWEWLSQQPGGASAALRRLVEHARRHDAASDRRERQGAAYAFLHAMAGDAPGFEEAARALFADDRARFSAITGGWPRDVAAFALELAGWEETAA